MARPEEDDHDEAEIARRRDEVVRRMIATPPKAKASPAKTPKPKAVRKTNP